MKNHHIIIILFSFFLLQACSKEKRYPRQIDGMWQSESLVHTHTDGVELEDPISSSYDLVRMDFNSKTSEVTTYISFDGFNTYDQQTATYSFSSNYADLIITDGSMITFTIVKLSNNKMILELEEQNGPSVYSYQHHFKKIKWKP